MSALVGTRTGIHKGKHTRNQQCGFMMGDGIRTGKDCTGLTVLALAIAEEKRVGSGIIMSQTTGLAYETTGECHTILNA